jgi:carbon storage regulator
MLVLSRRAGESVCIGDDVVITVLDVRGDVIRLGIRAPRSIQVHREEVWRELQRVNLEAASSTEVAEQALSTLLTLTPAPAPAPPPAAASAPAPAAAPAPAESTSD